MIWKINDEEVRICVLWALIGLAIAFLVVVMFARTPGFYQILFYPAIIAWNLLEYLFGPIEPRLSVLGLLGLLVGLPVQYLSYYLIIYALRKMFKYLTGTRGESNAKTEIWNRNHEDGIKSAQWALVSIPVSFVLLVFTDSSSGIGFVYSYPTIMVWAILGDLVESMTLLLMASLVAQYLTFFIFIYVARKIIKTRADNIAKEQVEKNISES